MDIKALQKIGYGLYVITSKGERGDNGMIGNAIMQLTENPNQIAVCINKNNYSHGLIKESGKMNVCCLSTDAPFSIIQRFGFQSGRDTDKFEGLSFKRSANGLAYLSEHTCAYFSLEVTAYTDMGSHGLFICTVTEAETLSEKEAMSYAYYHKEVKPQPQKAEKKSYVCTICGFRYEGEELPEDYVCPLCNHGAAYFEEVK